MANWQVKTWRATAADLDPQVARQGLWFGELWWQFTKFQRWQKLEVAQAKSLSGVLGVLQYGAAQQQKQHPELFA